MWIQGCIARVWSVRRGVSGGLRLRVAVSRGAGPAALAGRLRLPCCGHGQYCGLAGRGLYRCNRCRKQTSPTAGTIFDATKLPLTLWFAAIHLIVTAKNGILSVELVRRPPNRSNGSTRAQSCPELEPSLVRVLYTAGCEFSPVTVVRATSLLLKRTRYLLAYADRKVRG